MAGDSDGAEAVQPRAGGSAWFKLAALAVLASVGVFGIIKITEGAAGGSVEVTSGGVKFTQNREDNFADLLDKAIAADPGTVEALLSKHDFFRIDSPRLVDALARLDPGGDPTPVALGIRKLLWNLEGPFKGPGTLGQADERFVRALEELDRPVLEPGDKSRLIIELWQRSLERESPLGVRTFRASVVPVRPVADAPANMVFVCSGSGLANKAVTVWTNQGGLVTGVLTEDNRRLPCTELEVKLIQLFAGQPLTLGVDPALYKALADPQGSTDTLPPQVDAFFEVQPARLTALISKPE